MHPDHFSITEICLLFDFKNIKPKVRVFYQALPWLSNMSRSRIIISFINDCAFTAVTLKCCEPFAAATLNTVNYLLFDLQRPSNSYSFSATTEYTHFPFN